MSPTGVDSPTPPQVVAVIQARMDSIRLPGKVLQDVCGKSMLACTVRRVQLARLVDKVIIATTTKPVDDLIVEEANRLEVLACRGSEQDVLDRYLQAARQISAHTIVRITSDCPLIDPAVVDLAVASFNTASPAADYVSNTIRRTYPRGLDVEVFSRAGLEKAARESSAPHQREHVTPYFYENPDYFRLLCVNSDLDCSEYRWTVDTPEDLAFVREVYGRLKRDRFGWQEVLALLDAYPELKAINRGIKQKEVMS